jgi:hypothetical protein
VQIYPVQMQLPPFPPSSTREVESPLTFAAGGYPARLQLQSPKRAFCLEACAENGCMKHGK